VEPPASESCKEAAAVTAPQDTVISGPSGKRREMDTQFKVSKQNSILDLIGPYRILWKAVFDESHMYGLEGDLSYLSRSTLQYVAKKPKK
jgi:hypothetical protein